MARYSVKNSPKDKRRTLLLPVSYGLSSLSLLHILNRALERQRTAGPKQTAYDLQILAVSSPVTESLTEQNKSRIDVLKAAYPNYKYSEIPLHSVFQYDSEIKSAMSQFSNDPSLHDETKSDEERFYAFRASLTTATSRADFDETILRRLITAFAKIEECDAIIWGDSDTRLAAKTLANVSMGRGAGLPWDVCDGESPSGVYFNFPLRDIFLSELKLYSEFEISDLLSEIGIGRENTENLSNRNISIADLMTQYVEQQGSKYPGVMANIVRTVDKLRRPESTASNCVWCNMPAETKAQEKPTCYGCARTFMDVKSSNVMGVK